MISWLRVTSSNPCPVCGKSDWCLLSKDGKAAICPRTESDKLCGSAGWLHRLGGSNELPSRRKHFHASIIVSSPSSMDALADSFRKGVQPSRLEQFADHLGLSVSGLQRLGVGWSEAKQAWSFPMKRADGMVTGIRLRRSDSYKFSVRDGHNGLFIPEDLTSGVLFICEGPTDTAALLDLGFNAIGRPNCNSGTNYVLHLVRQLHPQRIVIVADNDEPGIKGANTLAHHLSLLIRDLRIITPPPGIKDARAWKAAGLTRECLLLAVEITEKYRTEVRCQVSGGNHHHAIQST